MMIVDNDQAKIEAHQLCKAFENGITLRSTTLLLPFSLLITVTFSMPTGFINNDPCLRRAIGP
jgi:hypothetical protein